MHSGLSEAARLIDKLEVNEELSLADKLRIIEIYTSLGSKATKELDLILGR